MKVIKQTLQEGNLSLAQPKISLPKTAAFDQLSLKIVKKSTRLFSISCIPNSGCFSAIRLLGMVPPNILRCIQLHQGIRHRLATIPIMIFLVSSEGNNDASGIVDVRGVYLGHVIDFPF
jgi:hypothetical protein